jgi:hypothetical protein
MFLSVFICVHLWFHFILEASMSFATDRDLIIFEPNLFRDVAFASQRLVKAGDGEVAGTTLTSASSDFEVAGVEEGHIVLLDRLPVEVIERLSPTELTVSLLRPLSDGDPIPPPPGTDHPIEVLTFAPQIEVVHRQVLRTLGIEPDEDGFLGTPGVENLVNVEEITKVEALGALDLIFTGAASLIGEQGTLWTKAQMYRQRFASARQWARGRFDLDGDGVADTVRFMNVVQFVRA